MGILGQWMTPGRWEMARKLLDQHGMTLEGGLLRKRGAKGGSILAYGNGAVVAVIHPKNTAALAVALYDRGERYTALEISFLNKAPNIAPLDLPEDAIAKLFPKKP